jgi:drug/metabolite transporter (DMT)-like permease
MLDGGAGRTRRAYGRGILCGLLAAAAWGGGAVVSRHLVTASLDPLDLAFLRYAGCLPIAALLVLTGRERAGLSLGWGRTLAVVLLAGPPYQALVFFGYTFTSAAGGALLLTGLLPLCALVLGCAWRRSFPPLPSLAGCAAVVTGLALFAQPGSTSLSASAVAVFGLAALLWAALNEAVRRWGVAPFNLVVALSFWSLPFIPVYFMLSSPGVLLRAPSSDLILQVLYHGWIVAFLATGLFFASVREAGPEAAATLQTLAPAFSAVLGAAFLGEMLTLEQAAALALTLAGVVVLIWSEYAGPFAAFRRRPRLPAAPIENHRA